jgi:hypothetical protein
MKPVCETVKLPWRPHNQRTIGEVFPSSMLHWMGPGTQTLYLFFAAGAAFQRFT